MKLVYVCVRMYDSYSMYFDVLVFVFVFANEAVFDDFLVIGETFDSDIIAAGIGWKMGNHVQYAQKRTHHNIVCQRAFDV